jgi:hypothetical protein
MNGLTSGMLIGGVASGSFEGALVGGLVGTFLGSSSSSPQSANVVYYQSSPVTYDRINQYEVMLANLSNRQGKYEQRDYVQLYKYLCDNYYRDEKPFKILVRAICEQYKKDNDTCIKLLEDLYAIKSYTIIGEQLKMVKLTKSRELLNDKKLSPSSIVRLIDGKTMDSFNKDERKQYEELCAKAYVELLSKDVVYNHVSESIAHYKYIHKIARRGNVDLHVVNDILADLLLTELNGLIERVNRCEKQGLINRKKYLEKLRDIFSVIENIENHRNIKHIREFWEKEYENTQVAIRNLNTTVEACTKRIKTLILEHYGPKAVFTVTSEERINNMCASSINTVVLDSLDCDTNQQALSVYPLILDKTTRKTRCCGLYLSNKVILIN